MKIKLIFTLLPLAIMISCSTVKGVYHNLYSFVENKFINIDSLIQESKFETWDKTELYVLRVEMEKKNKAYYKNENNIEQYEITDIPIKDYKLITDFSNINKKVVEEVYLYLSGYNNDVNSGSALYITTMPLTSENSSLNYGNDLFISTYGMNHMMTGIWVKEGDVLKISLERGKNKLFLKGKIKRKNMLEFTHVNHPKPLNKVITEINKFNDDNIIEFNDVFEIDPNKEANNTTKIEGIRFFKNENRVLIHPDWEKLGCKFDKDSLHKYYDENLYKRNISKVIIETSADSDKNIYFEVVDKTSKNIKKEIIKFKN